MNPPQWAIDEAIAEAKKSPCAKSRRGVVAYVDDPCTIGALGRGFNGPPNGTCTGTCRAICGQFCVHAETRAILEVVRSRLMGTAHAHPHLVHVKVVDGALVPGGPPSCWPCANLVVEARIGSVWLYEDMWEGPRWVQWPAKMFYESTLQRQPASPTYAPRNAIEVPCGGEPRDQWPGGGWCGAKDGAKRDRKGFWRCIRCGYPSP